MDERPDPPHTDETYRALGRYVVEFSRLIYYMRSLIAAEIAGGFEEHDLPSLNQVEIVLGDATASTITSAFFALCALEKDWDTEERRVAERLENRVVAEIKRRNDYAHGDWWIKIDGAPDLGPTLSRIKPSRRKEPAQSWEGVPPGELDLHSDALVALRTLVFEFGAITLDALTPPEYRDPRVRARVRDIFEIEGSRKHGQVRRRPDAPGKPPDVV